MKSLIALFVIGTSMLHAQLPVWQTRMIQSQIRGATGLPELVTDAGSRDSLPIGPDGSRFELWGWKLVSGVLESETLLASTEVGTYLPRAEVKITSADPFPEFARTRVDKPFTTEIKVENLLPESPENPEPSQKVFVEHYADLFTAGNYDGTSIAATQLVRSFHINQNGTTTYSFPVTNITAPDLARRAGRERFIVYALADGAVPMRPIASQTIAIYPAAEAVFAGLDETQIYRALPEFTVTVLRAYPGSSTWVEVYDGSFSSGSRGTRMPSTLEAAGHLAPPPLSVLLFKDLPDEFQPKLKTFKTFVVRSSAPFPGETIPEGGRILAYKTIRVDNTIAINAQMTSLE